MALDPAKVLTQATLRAAEALGLDNIELARSIGISLNQTDRLRSGELQIQPSSETGQLSLLLIRLHAALTALVGDSRELRAHWLRSHNSAFGEVPQAAMTSEGGLIRVVSLLEGYLRGNQ